MSREKEDSFVSGRSAPPSLWPKIVYHYTSMETMLKIVEGETIRATNIKYLNDFSEYEHFYNEIAMASKRSAIHDPVVQEVAQELASLRAFRPSNVDYPFVASFSSEGDSLPQWRAYCHNGNGVAIGFETASLEISNVEPNRPPAEFTLFPGFQFGTVSYLRKGDFLTLNQMLSESVAIAREWQKDEEMWGGSTPYEFDQLLRMAIETEATLIKDASFEAEQEYRLVATRVALLGRIHFRSTRSTLVPFVNIELANATTTLSKKNGKQVNESEISHLPYCISEVVIGPTPDKKMSQDSVKQYFRSIGRDVDVKPSNVPFRDII